MRTFLFIILTSCCSTNEYWSFYLDIYIYIFSRNTLKLFLRLTFNITTGTLAGSSTNLLVNTGRLFPKMISVLAFWMTWPWWWLYSTRSRWQWLRLGCFISLAGGCWNSPVHRFKKKKIKIEGNISYLVLSCSLNADSRGCFHWVQAATYLFATVISFFAGFLIFNSS